MYVFEGCLTVFFGDDERRLESGDFFMFASHVPHGYRNDGEQATRFVRNVVI